MVITVGRWYMPTDSPRECASVENRVVKKCYVNRSTRQRKTKSRVWVLMDVRAATSTLLENKRKQKNGSLKKMRKGHKGKASKYYRMALEQLNN